MNGTFILIGYQSANAAPENLYTGSSGVELMRMAENARECGKYSSGRLVKLVNPVGTPLPPVPYGRAVSVPVEVNTAFKKKIHAK